MTKEGLIKTLQSEMDYCEDMRAREDYIGNDARAIMWSGKRSGLKIALDYVLELDD